VVNWSSILILDLSVANSNSHELVSSDVLALHGVVMGGLGQVPSGSLVFVSNEVSRGDFFLNLSEADEFIASFLPDRNHLLNHVPHDALGSRGGGQRALECEPSVEVD